MVQICLVRARLIGPTVSAKSQGFGRRSKAPCGRLLSCCSVGAINVVDGGNHMAEMDQNDRDKLRQSQFAYVDKHGGEHLPINDESHVRNAMSRWNQTDFESKSAKESARKKIVAAAKKHRIAISDDDKVAHSAR